MTTSLDDASRFEVLASSIVGRPMRVCWGDGPTFTDGTTIELDPTFPERARDAVIVQAALLASGALDPDVVSRLRWRGRRIERHLEREIPRALAAGHGALPPVADGIGERQEWMGTIRPGRLMATDQREPESQVDLLNPAKDAETGQDDQGTEQDASRDRRQLGTGLARQKPTGGRGPTRMSKVGRGEANVTSAVLSRLPPPEIRLAQRDTGPVAIETPPPGNGAIATYPEWNERAGTYRADWCSVHHVPAPNPTGTSSQVSPGVDHAKLRRSLAMVRLDHAPVRRQPQGEDLDLDAVVQHRIDTRTSSADGAPLVYIAGQRIRRDLGVLVLVDGSGSTAKHRGDRSLAGTQASAATALVETFEALGDRVSCQVFRSHGRRHVEFAEIKGFDHRFDSMARARLLALRPEGFTRLGAGIRHATQLALTGCGTMRQLLVVLSDALPFDAGYEGREAVADARRSLSEARRAGVGSLCLSFGPAVDTAGLEAVFGSTTYASAPTLDALCGDLPRLVNQALAGADISRRTPALAGADRDT